MSRKGSVLATVTGNVRRAAGGPIQELDFGGYTGAT